MLGNEADLWVSGRLYGITAAGWTLGGIPVVCCPGLFPLLFTFASVVSLMLLTSRVLATAWREGDGGREGKGRLLMALLGCEMGLPCSAILCWRGRALVGR